MWKYLCPLAVWLAATSGLARTRCTDIVDPNTGENQRVCYEEPDNDGATCHYVIDYNTGALVRVCS